jgi:uncharacterized membrane protein
MRIVLVSRAMAHRVAGQPRGRPARRTLAARAERRRAMADATHRSLSALDEIDPDEWNATRDSIERARAQRRAERERRRAVRPNGGADRALLATRAGRVLAGAVGALALVTVIGLAVLWPAGTRGGEQQAFGGPTLAATVTATQTVRCPGPADQRCRQIVAKVSNGERARLDLGPLAVTPSLAAGDRVRVQRSEAGAPQRYAFADVDRRVPMLWLAIALAVLAAIVARWRGVLALVGVVLSVALVVVFLVPAILAGSDPVLVSLVAALAVMFVTLLLTYGPGAQSLAAALGIGLSLLLAAVVGRVIVSAAHLDGRTGELPVSSLGVSLQGIVLAGMVVGALGVLTDMAVSQASAVTALRAADPQLGPRALYRGAFAVGRDHLAATIHTLVLAYVGAALPLILVLRDAHVGLTDALNGQIVAEPVVATLVGAIALVAAVPLTTALAALLVARVPATALDARHGHAH